MKTKELLTQAAAAAGLEIAYWAQDDYPVIHVGNGRQGWNPLAFNSDALNLMVRMEMDVYVRAGRWTEATAPGGASYKACHAIMRDADAATRLAITMAAALAPKARAANLVPHAREAGGRREHRSAQGQHPMKRIYISGPMTGLPDLNFPAFHAAAKLLRERGHDAVNPAEINAETDGDWHLCMRADIRALCDCDALALLPGWQNSKGAHLELHLAHRLGMQIGTVEEFAAP